MCSVVVLRRPGHRWPLILAANRDEMADRPWKPPARHWPDRPEVVAGLDELANGAWLGLSDWGVVAGILNRVGTLGPAPGFRSRGELPLEALDHGEARAAATALADLDPRAYRPFNMVVADSRDAFWIRSIHGGNGGGPGGVVQILALEEGVSMITAHDCNDPGSPRIRRYLPRFREAPAPDPDAGDWQAWTQLLTLKDFDAEAGPRGAMTVVTETGFGTVSSSLIALPDRLDALSRPIWLFAPGPPDRTAFAPVIL
jgi:hypothetical protein